MATTKYPGKCQCGAAVPAGSSVTYDRSSGKFLIVACPVCAEAHAQSPEQAPSTTLTLQIKVRRVTFVKPDGSWTIAKCVVHGDFPPALETTAIQPRTAFAVVGPLGKVKLGDVLEVYGNLQHNAQYGWQLVAKRGLPVVDGTDEAFVAFLSGFPHIGRKRAEAILRTFGGRTGAIQVLKDDPTQLTKVAGITETRAHEIARAYVDNKELHESALFLASLDLGEALSAQILENYGRDTKAVILEDPYQLMTLGGVAFLRADGIARKLTHTDGTQMIASDDPRRLAAATLYLIETVERQGHTWSTIDDLLNATSGFA